MGSQERHILFLDNAGCHPTDDQYSYSNIKIVFLPPDKTSCLQPFNTGIIKNFKVSYRKLLMKFVVSCVNHGSMAAEIVNTIDMLQAIRWIKQAWQDVPQEIISKCFYKCGFSPSICESEVSKDTELFKKLANLIKHYHDINGILVEQHISANEEVPASAAPVNIYTVDQREALHNKALSFFTANADEPASKEVLVEDCGTSS